MSSKQNESEELQFTSEVSTESEYVVKEEAAKKIALSFLKNKREKNIDAVLDIKTLLDPLKRPYMYIVQLNKGENENSFVIVSGDKRLEPILAYGDNEFDLDHMPEQLEYWVQGYKSQVSYFRDQKEPVQPEILKEFDQKVDRIGSDQQSKKVRSEHVSPLLTTRWGQGCVFNSFLSKKEDIGTGCTTNLPCERAYTGCVATCLSQVVNYYNSMRGYDYTKLRRSYFDTDLGTLQGDEVARLMKEVGEIMDMEYTCSVSLAYSSDVLRSHVSQALGFTSPIKAEWFYSMDIENIISEMKGGNPLVISGKDYNNGRRAGHLWVLDGFVRYFGTQQNTTYFHFNLGWDGRSNGWYLYNDFKLGSYNFNQYVRVFYNFRK
ncbi:C10 family peptidase [Aquimarina sp. 2201CG1-2-11]|uniref:C10 family peptidase n=1 Tax=Aquimarina discodermiae TaxID=3231043 RepID=UPI0034637153